MTKTIQAYAFVNKKGQFDPVPIFSHYPRIRFVPIERKGNERFLDAQRKSGFTEVKVLITFEVPRAKRKKKK